MVYASMTHQYIFDYKKNDIYWCSADIGWVTGHSYIIYGPLIKWSYNNHVRGSSKLSRQHQDGGK